MDTHGQQAAVSLKPPPAGVIRLVNPMMRRLIRSRLGRRLAPLAVIGVDGRRTGTRREFNVGLHDVDGVLTVFTDRPWRHNFSGGAEVTVARGGTTWRGRGELVADPGLVGPALAAACGQVGPRKLGLRIRTDADPTVEDFAAVGKSMIRIRRGP
jgi:hypothetical protein